MSSMPSGTPSSSRDRALKPPDDGDLRGRTIRGSGTVVVFQTISTFLRLLAGIVLARLLSPEEVGILTIVVAICGPLLIFKDLGLCDAVIRWPDLTHRQLSTLFWINAGISVLVGICVIGLSPLLGWMYGDQRLPAVAALWALVVVFGGMGAQHLALLRRRMSFLTASIVQLGAVFLSSGCAIVMAVNGWSYWSLVFREVLNELFLCIGVWVTCRWRPGKPGRFAEVRKIVFFGCNTIASFVVTRISRNLDRALIGLRFGPGPTGLYGKAMDFVMMPLTILTGPLRNVAVASLSQLAGEPERFRRAYIRALRLLSYVAFLLGSLLVVSGSDLIVLVLGAQWEEAGVYFEVLSFGLAANIIGMTNVWLHFSLGRADRLAKWSLILASVLVATVMVTLPFGAMAVAWGVSTVLYPMAILGINFAGRAVKLSMGDILGSLVPPTIASICSGFGGYLIVQNLASDSSHLVDVIATFATIPLLYIMTIIMLTPSLRPLGEIFDVVKVFLKRRTTEDQQSEDSRTGGVN